MSAPVTTELQITGMTCNNCARHVTEAIQGVPNVRSAMVSLERRRATVRWVAADAGSLPAVLAAVAKAGFEAREVATDAPGRGGPAASRWQWNLIIGLGVAGALMAGEWGFALGFAPWFRWTAFALAGVVQVFCGAQFYAGAWRQLKAGHSNMDLLVALGSTTAFGYSAWVMLSGLGAHLYFMEAAAIISLVSFGHWLEARVSEQASGALKSLLNLAPQTARRLSPQPESGKPSTFNLQRSTPKLPPSQVGRSALGVERLPGSSPAGNGGLDLKALNFSPSPIADRQSAIETEVPVSELKVNDRVVLRPGDRVPVDGLVLEGESAVDESMLTGESAPVDKKNRGELYAGTLNLNGRLVMRVTATGEATALAHIVAAVQRAQTSRANIQRLGDRISNVFVPVIVTLALAAGLGWGLAPAATGRVHEFLAQFLWHAHAPAGAAAGFIIAAAVLIIACPCAMGLATPAAIMASANAAARRGILIRDGVALEKAGKLTAVIFDKTGTLTTGELAVLGPWTPDQSQKTIEQAWTLASAMATPSNHPVSKVLAGFLKANGATVPLNDWRELAGRGVQAHWQEGTGLPTLRLGLLSWLKEAGVEIPTPALIEQWQTEGASLVGLAKDHLLLGVFALRDVPRPGAARVISQIKRQGLKPYLLTGDNAATAAAVAKEVGIASGHVLAGVRPEQKAGFVKQLQAQGGRVAFVGDGINDGPALTQADLGIAVGRASDVAREAADIILLKSGIEAVPVALGLARQTLATIKQNLFWAFFYNALGVPLAALGFISPVFCAAAMGLSDLIVIGNALRLLRWRLPGEKPPM